MSSNNESENVLTPYYENQAAGVSLYHSDSANFSASMAPSGVDAVVTDPPWGVDQNSDNTRFPSRMGTNKTYERIEGDTKQFNPHPWLAFRRVALFGANCYSDKLPMGAWLVWCKRRDSMLGKFLADAETIWINKGFGVYILQHEWHGALKASEKGIPRQHPHQKPIAVMEWVLERLGVPAGGTVLDPYAGSGTTGIACINTGRKFIGFEMNDTYVDVAAKRLDAALAGRAA